MPLPLQATLRAHYEPSQADDLITRRLTSKGLRDAQIRLISGHESKKSLEVYQHLSL